MKKFVLFLCFIFVSLSGFTRNDFLPNPEKEYLDDTVVITNTSVCNGSTKTLSILSYLGFETSCVYSCDGVSYYTTEPNIVLTFDVPNDTTFMCYIDSMNGESLNITMAIAISVMHAPTISIDSIHNVTCPDGYLYPYGDGSFSVVLDDSVQNYAWIVVESDSSFFYDHTYYDSFVITGLRSGTYYVNVHGSNGCLYTDSVNIIQPEPWINHIDQNIIDTIKCGNPAYVNLVLTGGTGNLSFFWMYDFDSTMCYPNSSSLYFNDPGPYYVRIQDSLGCFFGGLELWTLTIYEFVVDTIHMESHDTMICPGEEMLLSAYSRGFGSHTWYVGEACDSLNYYTTVHQGVGYVAEYFVDTISQPQYIKVAFVDQNGCETKDSVWVDVYNSNISMTIQTQEIMADSMYTIQVSPPGGNLYMDDNLVASNIPSSYTFSTVGISAGEHVLKYAGVFGSEVGLYCEDEVSITIQVQVQPSVTVWDQEISIYPNPATIVLNLSSTEMMNMTVGITDITGRVIQTERVLDSYYLVDVSSLMPGVYLLCLESHDGAKKSIKFVKR